MSRLLNNSRAKRFTSFENANCKPNLAPMAKSKKAKRLDELAAQIRVCTRCPLHESRTLAVPGDGKYSAKVMIIAEAPGKEEDESGLPFVRSAGRHLDKVLAGHGLDRRDFLITHTVKCR